MLVLMYVMQTLAYLKHLDSSEGIGQGLAREEPTYMSSSRSLDPMPSSCPVLAFFFGLKMQGNHRLLQVIKSLFSSSSITRFEKLRKKDDFLRHRRDIQWSITVVVYHLSSRTLW